MNYRSEMPEFNSQLEGRELSACEIALWHALWDVAMICGRTEGLSIAAGTLALRTGFTKKTVERARKRLSECGVIKFRSRGGNRAALYDLQSLVRHRDAQSDPQTALQTALQIDPQPTPQSDPLYIATVNKTTTAIRGHSVAQTDPQTDPQGYPQPFLSDADGFALQEAMDAVLDASEEIGIPQNASDIRKANELIADYSAPWVLEAVQRAGSGNATARSWRYVEGILRNWRKNGGMDDGRPDQAGAAEAVDEQKRKRDELANMYLRGEVPK